MPDTLVVRGWSKLAETLPKDARLIRECLEDLPVERTDLTINWAG